MNSAHEKRGDRSLRRGTRSSLAANRRSGAAKSRTFVRQRMALATVIGSPNTSVPIEDETPDREHRARSRKRRIVVASQPTPLYYGRPHLASRLAPVRRRLVAELSDLEAPPEAKAIMAGRSGVLRTADTGTSRGPRRGASELARVIIERY